MKNENTLPSTPANDERLFLRDVVSKPFDAVTALEFMALWGIASRAVALSESVASVKYMRYPKLDRRFVAGDDFAGDAYVRWVAVGQKPDDAADISEPPKHEAMVTASMIDAALAACEQPPFLRDVGRLDLARIIRAALEVK